MGKPMFKKGDKVKIASDNDNENYDKFRGKTLTVTHVATNKEQHRGYDSAMEGMALYDFKGVPFSLYEYEIEPKFANGGGVGKNRFKLGDKVKVVRGANKGEKGIVSNTDSDFFGDYTIDVRGHKLSGFKADDLIKYAKGGGVGTSDTPKVWVGEWSLYNEGKLIGEWVDLSDFSSGEEVMEKIQELLDKWTKETGELREEYGIFDYENFPRSLYSEQMGEEEFEKVIKAWEFSQERDVPMDVIGNIISEYDPDDIEEFFDERYEGQFDSDTDLAYHYVDMVGGLEGVGKETVERYFDYESFGRDLAYDYNEYDGHYFRSYKRGGTIRKFDLKNYLTKGSFTYTIGGL
jgi:antirestriction protein